MDYVKLLIPYIRQFGKNIIALYWATGKEKSPIYPLLNYAAMARLLSHAEASDILWYDVTFKNRSEIKKEACKCMKEHMTCFVLTNEQSHGATVVIPTYDEGTESMPFTVMETNPIYFSFNSSGSTLMNDSAFDKEILVEHLNSMIYSLVSGLYIFLSNEFGETIEMYERRVNALPTTKELNRAIKESRGIPEAFPNTNKRPSMNDMEDILVMDGDNGEFVCQSKLAGENIMAQYIIPKRRETIYMSHNTFVVKCHPNSGFYRGYNPAESPEARKALTLYESCLNKMRTYIDAMKRQRQMLLDMCNNNQAIHEF